MDPNKLLMNGLGGKLCRKTTLNNMCFKRFDVMTAVKHQISQRTGFSAYQYYYLGCKSKKYVYKFYCSIILVEIGHLI